MLVTDSSLVVELALDRIGSEVLAGENLVAPPLLWSEVPSVLSELAYRREVSTELAEEALRRFLDGEIKIEELRPEGLTLTAWAIARELGWAKTYDAEFVALARLLDCRLLTLDLRLRRGADRLGSVITPAEL